MMLTRRALLHASGMAGLAGFMPNIRAAYAASVQQKPLIVINLRGALDGLHVVPPLADPAYSTARRALALSLGDDRLHGASKLDSFFGLHTALKNFGALYQNREALVVHAVASPYRDRSHFDAQDLIENGSPHPYGLRTGWLNRALSLMASYEEGKAVCVGSALPLMLQGSAKTASWSPSSLPDVGDDTLARLMQLYQSDPAFSQPFLEALKLETMVADATMENQVPTMMPPAGIGGGFRAGRQALQTKAAIAVKLMREANGPTTILLEGGGWDTHAGQAGAMAYWLTDLDQAIQTFKQGLGALWSQTMLVVITEFGRTVAVNGTGGTDHGTGTLSFIAGGAIRGGRVLADWPGLQSAQLYQGRDLAPTTDLRSVLKGVLISHWNLNPDQLANSVFPESEKIKPLEGLV
jgi:uncharacterized protein (DUF1501 family)